MLYCHGKKTSSVSVAFPLQAAVRRSPPAKGKTFSRESELRDDFRRCSILRGVWARFWVLPDLLEATLISRDCRENVAQQEDLSNQLEKGDPGITSGDLCTRIEALLIVKNPQPGALATGFSHTPLYPPLNRKNFTRISCYLWCLFTPMLQQDLHLHEVCSLIEELALSSHIFPFSPFHR